MWEQWIRLGRPSRLAAGQLLWQRGEPCTEVVLLLEGGLEVVQESLEGEVAVVRTLGAGEILGEMSALDQGVHSATVRARQDCSLHRIPAAEFRSLVERRPELMRDLLARQNARVRHLTRHVAVLGFESVAQRVARYLTRELPPGAGPVALTHRDLAERVAATRESVTKALGLLSRQGLVSLGRGSITILDRPGLAAMAGED